MEKLTTRYLLLTSNYLLILTLANGVILGYDCSMKSKKIAKSRESHVLCARCKTLFFATVLAVNITIPLVCPSCASQLPDDPPSKSYAPYKQVMVTQSYAMSANVATTTGLDIGYSSRLPVKDLSDWNDRIGI